MAGYSGCYRGTVRGLIMDLFLRTKKDLNNSLHNGQPGYFWSQGENDLIIDSGDFVVTEGVDNLNQSMAKILVTERGANPFFPLYGSLLQSFIGRNLNVDYFRARIKTDIIDSLRIYQFINKNNANLDEQIDTLDALKINLLSPDGLDVSFRVITSSGKTVGSLIKIEG